MFWRNSCLLFINFMALLLIPVYCADKYTDENRPYEFGFNIEGEQHRHEKKDENGLIMGEFGFITADGVYHVTVYATDENGNFKILSMKNIRVRPYPTAKTSERTGHSLKLPAVAAQEGSSAAATTQATTTTNAPKRISLEPARACSHCSIPTKSTAPPPVQKTKEKNYGNAIAQYPQQRNNVQNITPVSANTLLLVSDYPKQLSEPKHSQQEHNSISTPVTSDILPPVEDYPKQQSEPKYSQQGPAVNNPQFDLRSNYDKSNLPNNLPSVNQQPFNDVQQPYEPEENEKNVGPQISNKPGIKQETQLPQNPGQRESKQYDINDFNNRNVMPPGFDTNSLQNKPEKPVLVSAQMQIVDKNTDIYHKNPGETDGLPQGLNEDDVTTLLYTFNYTVGFHGHYEEGYKSGAKKGYYFITGRNGVRTRVDYEADAKGFRPKITQEILDILSDDVPKQETEKDDKYGLKGYEFKWLYFPADSNRR